MRNKEILRNLLAGLMSVAFLASPAIGQEGTVDLDLRPDHQRVALGSTVSIVLYAISSGDASVSISAMDVVIVWDAAFLGTIGFTNAGNDYNWLMTGFMYPGGLNADLSDGDAVWTAFAQLGMPAYATPQGLRVTTFQFRALAPANEARVAIEASRGGYNTVVYWGGAPNTPVTGTLDPGVTVSICGPSNGDVNVDGCVDDADLLRVLFVFGSTQHAPEDVNCDGIVDDADLLIVLFNFGSGC